MKGEDFLKSLKDVNFLREGWRGRIFVGYTQSSDAIKLAIKIARKPELIKNIKNEAYILRKVNQYRIGPELIFEGEDFIATRFIEGETFDKIITRLQDDIEYILFDILEQARMLDILHISKDEMHKPYKNIIVQKDRKPVLIDFESARETEKPKNVTQFVSFIFSLMRINGKIRKREDEKVVELMKEYKKSYSDTAFSEILSFLKGVLRSSL